MVKHLRDTVDGINERGWERAMLVPMPQPPSYCRVCKTEILWAKAQVQRGECCACSLKKCYITPPVAAKES